jgi:hypothetical protein
VTYYLSRNLGDSVRLADKRGVKIIIIYPASNLKWWWGGEMGYDDVMEKDDSALYPHERLPFLQYRQAWALEEAGDYNESLQSFGRYKELADIGWVREEAREVMAGIAQESQSAVFIDFEKILINHAIVSNTTIGCNYFGNDWYCDQVHPNELTHLLIAESLYPLIINLSGNI